MAVVLGEEDLLDCDLVMVRGASFFATVTWERDGASVDLVGARAKCQVRRENDGELLADLSSCWTFWTGGQMILDVPPSTTWLLPGGKWYWDLVVKEPTGFKTRVLAGRCKVVDPISEDGDDW